ncbi:MAG: ADOP family duplicated permease, partial [Gemmatimonadota bacterium]
LKDQARDTWRWRWLDELVQDLGYAVRSLRKSPGFAAVAVLSLGFGIGATTTMFSVIDALDFRPVPFPNAGRLVWVTEISPRRVERCPTCSEYGAGLRAAAAWQARAHSYDAFGYVGPGRRAVLREGDRLEQPSVFAASPGFFQLLGVHPALGGTFLPDDTLPGAEPVVLLSYRYWRTHFGGDRDIVGRRFHYFKDLAGTDPGTLTVAGVLPQGFHFVPGASLWRPYSSAEGVGRSRLFTNVARLKPGVTPSVAAAEMRVIGAVLARENPDVYGHWRFEVRPLRELLGRVEGGGRPTLFLITILVLLIAVLNVAGLFLARATSRRGELSVRSALGASRVRLVRQLLVEGVALGLVGGVVGGVLTWIGVRAAGAWFRLADSDLPPRIDYRVLAFVVGLSVLVGILTALVPALRSVRADLAGNLRDRPGTALAARRGGSARVLLAAQIACALVLVAGAAFVGSDFLKVRYVDLGFDPNGLQRAYLDAPPDLETSPEAWRPVTEQVRDRLVRTPGVAGVALEAMPAMRGEVRTDRGYDASAEPRRYPEVKAVEPSYFATLRNRILAGRNFTPADHRASPPVALVNAAAAASFWPGENPLGHRVFVGDSADAGTWLTVVGVAADAEILERIQRHVPVVYQPFAQASLSSPRATLYVRLARGRPGALKAAQAAVRQALGRPVFWDSMEEFFSVILARQRYNAIALNLFAAFAVLLAAMGVYGSVAYAVSSRTREIGVRMALGARKQSVLALVAGHSLRLTVAGVALGLAGAVVLTRVLRAFTWAAGVLDPWLLGGSIGLMALVVSLATYLPARRAMRIDPAIALRSK